MLTLAIDTSGTLGSIALARDSVCLEERILRLGQHHGQSLIPEIHALLAAHGAAPRDCGLIAVCIGPGSFTGLRVGIVCAKTYAYATGCAIAGIGTFDAVARNAPPDVAHVHVVSDAQRGELFACRFDRTGIDAWHAAGTIRIVDVSELAMELSPADTIMGPALEKYADAFAGRCRILDSGDWHPRSKWLAQLGESALREGSLSDPWSLEPMYLRKSAAEEKWELKQAQQQQQ